MFSSMIAAIIQSDYNKPEPEMVASPAKKAAKAAAVEGAKRGRGRPRKVSVEGAGVDGTSNEGTAAQKAVAAPVVANIPIVGSISAAQFIKLSINAGVRGGKFDKDLVREDLIRALIGFGVGFNPAESLAKQVDDARHKARAITTSIFYGEERRPAFVRVVPGIPTGYPSLLDKRIGDLQGRLNGAIDEVGECNLALNKVELTGEQRSNLCTLLGLALERIKNIQLLLIEVGGLDCSYPEEEQGVRVNDFTLPSRPKQTKNWLSRLA